MAGRGTQWERKGEAGGGPASYRARPAAAGVGGGGKRGVSWRRRRRGGLAAGQVGVFGLMGRGLNPVKRSIVNGSVG